MTAHLLVAMQAIDTLALNLQNKWVFGDCLAFAQSAIHAQDTYLRAAGCTVLVVIAEGCCDACTAKLTDLLQVGVAGPWSVQGLPSIMPHGMV